MALVCTQAAQVFFDAIEPLDLRQAFLCDRCRAKLGDIMQFAGGMRPAIDQFHILSRAFKQPIIACLSVHLQGAAEDIVCSLTGSTRRVGKGNARWILPALWPVIAGKRSEASGFGAFAPWC